MELNKQILTIEADNNYQINLLQSQLQHKAELFKEQLEKKDLIIQQKDMLIQQKNMEIENLKWQIERLTATKH